MRRLYPSLAVVSALLCAAAMVFWVRSRTRTVTLTWEWDDHRTLSIDYIGGRFAIAWGIDDDDRLLIEESHRPGNCPAGDLWDAGRAEFRGSVLGFGWY